ncbi:MAG: Integrase core domain protein [Tenericutes bacterium ADurb.BinA155]|jgi:putative transposase|nr:MAG: Integrase core domain protein [Tenericutes bacterium ADurb.BinA155]
MKYTFEQKLKWVRDYMSGGSVPVPKGCPSSLKGWHRKVLTWIHVYEIFGEKGLIHGRDKKFSQGRKIEAVRRVLAGESISGVAYSLGMANCACVMNWLRAYREKGEDGLQSKPKGRKPKHAEEDDGAARGGEQGPEKGERAQNPRDSLLKKLEGLGGVGGASPRQRFEAVLQTKEESKNAKIGELLAVAKLAKSTYFYEKSKADPDAKNEGAAELIASAFEGSRGRYGVRRVWAQLRAEGVAVNHKKVQRLMKKMGLKGIVKTVNYNSYRGTVGKVAPDLIIEEYVRKDGQTHHRSDFSCGGPDEKWTTDVSQFSFPWGKCYLSPIKDMFTGEIVAYDLSLRADFSQTRRMLDSAFSRHPGLRGLIFHSDQGWQYQQRWYVGELRSRGIRQSMSRKGNCLDNCIMESFFGSMKREMFYGRESEYPDFQSFKKAVDSYILWYNSERLRYFKGQRKWMSPLACREACSVGHPYQVAL